MEKLILKKHKKLRLLVDINDTLIRTGQVEKEDRISEIKALYNFVENCANLGASLASLEVVFLTGNSFEYTRRIEEALGIKNIHQLHTIIVSENGLLGRSFRNGNLWHLRVDREYTDSLRKLMSDIQAHSILQKRFYTQGNEIRLTIKPVANTFTQNELSLFSKLTQTKQIRRFSEVYISKYYVDLDPKIVYLDNAKNNFTGKKYAVEKLNETEEMLNIAVGDSLSDVPMFQAALETGGKAYWVANTKCPDAFPQAEILPFPFTNGVNSLLEKIEVA